MSSKDASRHLRLLFSFPSLRMIVFMILMLESTMSLVMLALFQLNKMPPQILILFFTPSLFTVLMHKAFLREDRVLTFRRFLALQLVQEALYAFLTAIGALSLIFLNLDAKHVFSCLIPFGITISSFISFLTLLGFLRRSVTIILPVSLLYTSLQSLRWIIMSMTIFQNLAETFSVILLSFLTSLLLATALSLKKIGGKIKPLTVFQAYLDYYFNKNEAPLEEFFEETSRDSSLKLSSATFTVNGKPFLSLIGLGIHFGPFGTLGSSPLPSRLVEELEDNSGRRILLLRFLSNHSLNLPSKKEVEKIGSMIMTAFNSAKSLEGLHVCFSQRESEGYCVTAVRLGSCCIVFLSCPGYSAEDLPPEWLPRFSTILEKHGLTPILVCDAHNSIDSSSWTAHNPDENRFADLLEEVAGDLEKALPGGLEIGFHRVRPQNLPNDEIGPGGVSALIFNIAGRTHAIITIDGNNMVMGMRNRLVESLRETLNISALEIVTTDTHVLTGLKQAWKGYFPVGFKTGFETLLEACREALNSAVERLSPCGVEVYVDDTNRVKMTGKIFMELEELVEYSEKTIIASLILLVFSTGLLLHLI
ncbi:MAG: DUF2070 family protein [Thermoproteota archaeon]